MTTHLYPQPLPSRPVPLSVALLDPHPDNPRIVTDAQVVATIAAELSTAGTFPVEHAPLVRPHHGRYQIVSGHHRVDAARKAGLETVPCWVRDLDDDDEAYAQLALANTQTELSQIERGIHIYRWTEPSQGRQSGRSIQSCADRLGVSRQYASKLRAAAEVYITVVERWEVEAGLKALAFAAAVYEELRNLGCEGDADAVADADALASIEDAAACVRLAHELDIKYDLGAMRHVERLPS